MPLMSLLLLLFLLYLSLLLHYSVASVFT